MVPTTLEELLAAVPVHDALGAEHRAAALAWLASTDDVWRRSKGPSLPSPHLVSYVVPRDPAGGDLLLLDHVTSGLRLPPGGHVEPGEHPREAAVRELAEELGVAAEVGPPVFLTVTDTVGADVHTDVSLWFVAAVPRSTAFVLDGREARSADWFTPAEAAALPRADPHLARFVAALG